MNTNDNNTLEGVVLEGSIGHYEATMERERYLMKRSEGQMEWDKHWGLFQVAKKRMEAAFEARRLADIANGYDESDWR